MNLTYETETDSQTERMNLWFPGEKCRETGIGWEFGIDVYT